MKLGLVGGFDSSQIAGISADSRMADSFGVETVPVVTANTVQTFDRFGSMETLHADFQKLSETGILKIGMLGSRENTERLATFLETYRGESILDPVLKSTSGGKLGEAEWVRLLLPRVSAVTPNLPESLALGTFEAERIFLKGGHELRDFVTDQYGDFSLTSPRIMNVKARGTGCGFATALACGRARGLEWRDAFIQAKVAMNRGLRLARDFRLATPPWPTEILPQDFPQAGREWNPHSFPLCGRLDFYPVVDSFDWVEQLCEWGVQTIQLRVKSGEDLDREIRNSVGVARAYGVNLFINDHWNLAIKHGAYGVHLGQDDLRTADLGALKKLRLGISTHSLEELAIAHSHRPSYIALGPIFPTATKAMRFSPQGLETLKLWRALCDVPLVAIGGITLENAPSLLPFASGVAVLSDVTAHSDPKSRVHAWLSLTRGVIPSPMQSGYEIDNS